MDLKRLGLLGLRKIWIVLLAALTGALAGCACYLIVHVVYAPAREYEAVGKLYIDFAEKSTGEAYQYYNGYTWDDLMKTDPILKYTMTLLPESYQENAVRDAVTAEILTDIRLLTITVRTHDPLQTKEILDATEQSLVHFATTIRELEQITVYRTTEPEAVIFNLQTGRVAAVCAVLCALVALLVLFLYYAMDDAIYLPEDICQRYGLPVLGVLGWQEEELRTNLDYRYQNKKVALFVMEETTEKLPNVEAEIEIVSLADGTQVYEKLRRFEKVLIQVPCGRKNGKQLGLLLEQLKIQNCPADAVILSDADEKLLNQYYGRRTPLALEETLRQKRQSNFPAKNKEE